MALTPTYYNIGTIKGTGISQGDLHKCLYNIWKAVHAICYNIDDDAGTIGTDYMDNIGTDLNTALALLNTPASSDTT